MRISDNGIQFIKDREGLRLRAYKDTAGVWTIGYGHTHGVRKRDIITESQATTFLIQDLRMSEDRVNSLVQVSLTQNQFDALVSFEFNLGRLGRSALLRLLNQKKYISAAGEFEKWNKEHIDGKLIANKGLSIRRDLERILFLS